MVEVTAAVRYRRIRGCIQDHAGRVEILKGELISMLLLIIVLLLLFGGGGGYYGYSRWGRGGGLGIVGTVVLIALVLYFVGVLR
jgi:hypothetical protein